MADMTRSDFQQQLRQMEEEEGRKTNAFRGQSLDAKQRMKEFWSKTNQIKELKAKMQKELGFSFNEHKIQ